jgi:hypothetical protein
LAKCLIESLLLLIPVLTIAETLYPIREMKEIIDKISSYNLFNYLFPGVIFVILLREITEYDLVQENNFLGAFLYYFIGLVISRFGSLVIGEILQNKKMKFIEFADYTDFIFASDKDQKIELFSEINNMYRTLISLFCLLLLSKLYQVISDWLNISENLSYILLILVLIILFVFSYRKQTGFVVKRVASRTEKK